MIIQIRSAALTYQSTDGEVEALHNITLDMEGVSGEGVGSIGINFWLENKTAENFYSIESGK